MNKYTVDLVVRLSVVVDARDNVAAIDAAVNALPWMDTSPFALQKLHGFAGRAAPEDARAATYVCVHCDGSSVKAAWGPGRVRCPGCGKLAPAAGDHAG